jgi:hypothetical protein
MDVPSRFDVDLEIVKLYLESAKTYMELSIALVGLTVVFREKILGSKKLPEVQILTLCSWLSLLLSIGFNSLYQYAAVHFLDSISPYPAKPFLPVWLVNNPGRAYGVMVILFYLGAILFVASAFTELIKKKV